MPGRTYKSPVYQWWLSDPPRFWAGMNEMLEGVRGPDGIFAADCMVVWARNLGFLDEERFVEAWSRNASAPHERGILWRTAVLVWAARQGIRREGGIVECGCYAGTSMRIVMDTVDLSSRDIFLYDLFEHEKGMAHHAMPEHGPELFDRVCARFANETNVRVVRGFVPDSFAQGVPEKVAFAHIDMNNAPAEIAALDALEPRFVPGAVIVLDDFGQSPYVAQHMAHREWFGRRNIPILEIPTGQGIIIW